MCRDLHGLLGSLYNGIAQPALLCGRYCAVDKENSLTSYIERSANTLRQRVWRLVRKTLSFSKNLDNHSGAIWDFIPLLNRTAQFPLRVPQDVALTHSPIDWLHTTQINGVTAIAGAETAERKFYNSTNTISTKSL
jgi:IS1 transposase